MVFQLFLTINGVSLNNSFQNIQYEFCTFHLQVGAIFIWSYTYPFVRAYARKSMEHSSSDQESCKEPLLQSSDCNHSEDYSGQGELPLTSSSERLKVFSLFLFSYLVVQCLFENYFII